MINTLLFALSLVSALGCGLIAGVFFAFSVFVMKALASLPPTQGIAAMQSINVTVLNSWFLGAFFGTAAGSIFLAGVMVVNPYQHSHPSPSLPGFGSILRSALVDI